MEDRACKKTGEATMSLQGLVFQKFQRTENRNQGMRVFCHRKNKSNNFAGSMQVTISI